MRELQIQFGHSRSEKFDAALKLAEGFRTYALNNGIHSITIQADRFTDDVMVAEKLWNMVKDWKSVKILIDGDQASTDIFGPLKCYSGYFKAIIQSIHCKRTKELPGWSCKQLLAIERHSCCSSYPWDNCMWWFQVGRFISKTVWEIDKKEIAVILKRESIQKHLSLCPNFSWEKVQIHIDNLPATIDLETNDLWEYSYLHEPGFSPRVIGVKPKTEKIESLSGFNND